VLDVMQGEVDRLNADPDAQPRTFDSVLSETDLLHARSLVEELPRVKADDAATYDRVKTMLELVSFGVSVTDAGRGDSGVGLMRYSVKVPDALTNIAILDASHTIRELTRDGRTKDKTTAMMLRYKSYTNVTVRGVKLPASKTALRGEGTPKCAKEVLNAIDATPPGDSVLIFTHRATRQRLKTNMVEQGWCDEMLPDGKTPRASFLTWGQETSSNDWTHVGHIIMAGVMRRDPLDLAASLTGQQRQTRQHSRAALDRLNRSEMAHCVLQGMHRGRCRLADDDGCAKSMLLTLIDSDADEVRSILLDAACLPGIDWPVSAKSPHATRSKAAPPLSGRMQKAIAGICNYLRAFAGDSITKRALTNAVPELTGIHKNSRPVAISKALVALDQAGIEFKQSGRNLARG
jgi:hypothetical protein